MMRRSLEISVLLVLTFGVACAKYRITDKKDKPVTLNPSPQPIAKPGEECSQRTEGDTAIHECPNSSLRAKATPRTVLINHSVQFAATCSPMGFIRWQFGDGNVATGANVSHKYLTPATYSVDVSCERDGKVVHTVRLTVSVGVGTLPPGQNPPSQNPPSQNPGQN